MSKPNKIIRFLDKYIQDTGIAYLEAPEANKLLEQAGLLPDSPDRKGLPLRKLLRAGEVPHAYLNSGRWVIPHSSSHPKSVTQKADKQESAVTLTVEEVRTKYKPARVSVLLVGESAPAGGTFFYFGNSNLYRATAKAFSSALERQFATSDEFFRVLIDNGIYLEDLCSVPVNHLSNEERESICMSSIEPLAGKLATYSPTIVISLMKGIEPHIRAAIEMANMGQLKFYGLPFPSHSSYNRYVDQLRDILEGLELR